MASSYERERERRIASPDEAIARGIADADAGRVHDLDDVCDELDSELAALEGSHPITR